MFHSLIEWMGGRFSPEAYLAWTRVQCTAWTLADLVLVFYLLRLANLARKLLGRAPHRASFALLAATVPLAAVAPFAQSGGRVFVLEVLITVPHFALIVYVLLADTALLWAALARVAGRSGAPVPPTNRAT